MFRWFWAAYVAFMAGFAFGVNAKAYGAQGCLDRKKVMAHLAEKYQELPRSFMLIDNQQFLEIYTSRAGTWTIIRYDVNDCGQVVSSGNDYQDYDIHFDTY